MVGRCGEGLMNEEQGAWLIVLCMCPGCTCSQQADSGVPLWSHCRGHVSYSGTTRCLQAMVRTLLAS